MRGEVLTVYWIVIEVDKSSGEIQSVCDWGFLSRERAEARCAELNARFSNPDSGYEVTCLQRQPQ